MAIGLLLCAQIAIVGSLIPHASSGQWMWIGISGIVGLGIGDTGLFAGYVTIGPRRTVLLQASAPIITLFAAYFILGETISPLATLGIAITLLGIYVVLAEEEEEESETKPLAKNRKAWGILFGLISATGQGLGAVLSKKGMYFNTTVPVNPVSTALIRMLFAGAFVWIAALVAGRLPAIRQAAKDKQGIKYTAAGAVVGPFIGMTLSMVALAYTQAGIAQTLMSLMPIFIIPVLWIVYKEKTNSRGIIGAIVAIIGVAIIFIT